MAIKIRTSLFSRQPLSAFDKVNFGAFLGSTVASAVLAISIGSPDNGALIIVATVLLVCTFLVLTGLRWMPLLLAFISGIFLYQIAKEPFVGYHLTNPKGTGGGGEFLAFVLDVLIIAFFFLTLGASIGAVAQNYRKGERHTPRWLASAITGIGGIVLGSILVAAIAQPISTSTVATTTNGVPTVHMGPGSFLQSAVAVTKGSKLLLVNDTTTIHILANGAWQNGTAKAEKEAGAPTIDNIQVSGKNIELGPFTTAGTYHIYCTVHEGMNLTILVQ